MSGDSGGPVVTTLVWFIFSHARLRVHRAPGIPHALYRAEDSYRTRALHAAGVRRCVSSSLRAQRSNPWTRAATWRNGLLRRVAPRNDEKPMCLTQHDPRRRMVAGVLFASHFAVDAGLDQARGERRAQQQMIEPQSGVARPAVTLVVPEGEHRLCWMNVADRVTPALRHQRFEP